MTAEEPTDDSAGLERIAGFCCNANDLPVIRQAAALIRRQADRIARDREVFVEIEWMAEVEGYSACPWCAQRKKDGHIPDCRLKVALESPP